MLHDHAYCINLLRRDDRKIKAIAEFEKIGLEVEFIEAVDGKDLPTNESGLIGGYQALNQTLINIVDDAIAKEYESIRILEDDIVFTEDHAQSMLDNESNIPEDFSVFYYGCINEYGTPKIGGRIHKVRLANLGHDFVIKKEIFEPYRDLLSQMIAPSDVCLSHIYSTTLKEDNNYKYSAYCILKGVSGQREGYSDNLKSNTSIEVN
jgi:GR25 family glycosyltransferase involved in LPS biosynthesis